MRRRSLASFVLPFLQAFQVQDEIATEKEKARLSEIKAPAERLGDKVRYRSALRRRRVGLNFRDGFHVVVEKMTNHQRNQWARAGYPGLGRRDPSKLKGFSRP